jgi:hypothetical protein
MSRLSMADRRALPKSAFAVPSKAPGPGSYPITDAAHARVAKALARYAPESQRPTIDQKANRQLKVKKRKARVK